MKTKLHYFCILLALFAGIHQAAAQGTAFTYQGRLNSNGSPANGGYDMIFALFATNTSGVAIAGPVTNSAVLVTNGLFTTTVDFGNVFTGSSNWLEIAVSTNGANSFSTLAPRQQLTPVPYAVTAANLSGAVAAAQLPASVITNGASGVYFSGTISGNGGGVTNLNIPGLSEVTGTPNTTNYYTTNGTYTITVPAGATEMFVKLWGAGGGGGMYNNLNTSSGGGGGFSQMSLNVMPGESYVVVVGQSGDKGGGIGSNDGAGGSGGGLLGIFAAYGGQASALFKSTGSAYVMKAVAGGGAGGGPSYGGGAGQANGSGAGYGPLATTLGYTNLNLMGGDGADIIGFTGSGGGGGGYGGGNSSVSTASSGGGCYGDLTMSGSFATPANTGDPDYVPGAAVGGNAAAGDGLVVVIFSNAHDSFSVPVLAPLFSGNGSGLTSLNAASLFGSVPPVSLTAVPASNLVGSVPTASLTAVPATNLVGPVPSTSLTAVPAASLTGTIPAANFQTTTVTNFASVGPLGPTTFSFSTHGGTLLITADGAGSTSSAPIAIGMTVSFDGTIITTNRVFSNVNSHLAFVSKTLVRRGVAAGNHTITLTSWNGTTTDINDNYSVAVQELPY